MNQLNTISTQGVQVTQREISAQSEMLSKSLAELAEEVLGLNGTFSAVLQPKAPQPQGASDRPAVSACVTEAARFIEGANSYVQNIAAEVRSLRERCEL